MCFLSDMMSWLGEGLLLDLFPEIVSSLRICFETISRGIDYIGLYRIISDYIGLYQIISDYIGLYRIISDYIGLYQIISDDIGLYRILSNYIGLYQFEEWFHNLFGRSPAVRGPLVTVGGGCFHPPKVMGENPLIPASGAGGGWLCLSELGILCELGIW